MARTSTKKSPALKKQAAKKSTAASKSAPVQSTNRIPENGQTEKSLKSLFTDLLKDIYNAEQQLTKALPKVSEAAYSPELKAAVDRHLDETKEQISRIEEAAELAGIELGNGKKCAAMEGLIKEGEEIIKHYAEGYVRDSALIIGSQKIEHYEIAVYGSLCELADVLQMDDVHDILGENLDEEEETDDLLTELASDINDDAFDEMDNEQEDEEDEEEEEEERDIELTARRTKLKVQS